MARKQFSKSDIKKFLQKQPEAESIISKKSVVVQENNLLFVDDLLTFIQTNDKWFPSLKLFLKYPNIELLPKVIVDMGAVKFVVNGADVMRPGIVGVGSFNKDDFVVIVDENNDKPLAIGQALFSSEEMMNMKSGKVIKILHHVGDQLWEK
jgi:PUA domain protein